MIATAQANADRFFGIKITRHFWARNEQFFLQPGGETSLRNIDNQLARQTGLEGGAAAIQTAIKARDGLQDGETLSTAIEKLERQKSSLEKKKDSLANLPPELAAAEDQKINNEFTALEQQIVDFQNAKKIEDAWMKSAVSQTETTVRQLMQSRSDLEATAATYDEQLSALKKSTSNLKGKQEQIGFALAGMLTPQQPQGLVLNNRAPTTPTGFNQTAATGPRTAPGGAPLADQIAQGGSRSGSFRGSF